MALHRLLGMEIGVPDPATLDDFYQEIGLTGSGGQWGPDDQPGQIQLVEAPYRQLRRMRVACEGEADIDRAARNLDELGIKYETGDGQLRCTDPINAWQVVLEPTEVSDVSTQPVRVVNRPGDRPRTGARAEIILEEKPRPPRRLGHIVTGTPDPVGTLPIYEALGFRVSDTVLGMVFFLRCSPDHHNFLITWPRRPRSTCANTARTSTSRAPGAIRLAATSSGISKIPAARSSNSSPTWTASRTTKPGKSAPIGIR